MRTCNYPPCGLPVPLEVDPEDPYCTRECFDAHINDALAEVRGTEPVSKKSCNVYSRIALLRDDATARVKNLESFGSARVGKTKEYFQARADVLDDLLAFCSSPEANCSCK